MQSTHPREFLPAYVLGALDADAAQRVRDHLVLCHECRAEADSFRAAVARRPTTTIPGPSPHVKRRLMARVAADLRHQAGIARLAAAVRRWLQRFTAR